MEPDFGGKRNPDGQGLAAFGRVVKGMAVVRKIQASPAEGPALTPPVKILKAARKLELDLNRETALPFSCSWNR